MHLMKKIVVMATGIEWFQTLFYLLVYRVNMPVQKTSPNTAKNVTRTSEAILYFSISSMLIGLDSSVVLKSSKPKSLPWPLPSHSKFHPIVERDHS